MTTTEGLLYTPMSVTHSHSAPYRVAFFLLNIVLSILDGNWLLDMPSSLYQIPTSIKQGQVNKERRTRDPTFLLLNFPPSLEVRPG